MEHSYIGNSFVEAVEFLLIDDGEGNKGRWSGNKIVWAGDYADDEPNEDFNLYSLAEEVMSTNFAKIGEDGKVRKREDGKVLKPVGWVPPNLTKFI